MKIEIDNKKRQNRRRFEEEACSSSSSSVEDMNFISITLLGVSISLNVKKEKNNKKKCILHISGEGF
jgi:hypothetical protein